ncbi:MAG: type I-E CRISPR-associated protein Cse2/CasB [Proteobacteria bacterium]|jgi:CRISPR system Cascade subunit CasB|nr:type I-E CRISPR-associated protein Cse2/CasB [Pseudomonadota bacterium]
MSERDRFIGHLEALAKREDRGALANLRRGLGKPPGACAAMMPLIVPHLPEDRREHLAYFLVATLFALHPESARTGNMGTTFRRLGDNESAEKRFVALLDSHADELGARLRHAVSLARSKAEPINYRQLLDDVLGWDHPERVVQLAWARQYWRQTEVTEGPNNDNASAQGAA